MIIDNLIPLEEQSYARAIPIIGREKGKWLLKMIVKLKPKLILELGTANGYSGIILGSEGAELTTVDQNPRIIEEARQNFSQFNIKAEIIFGEGVKVVKRLVSQKKQYDLIFLDFAKKNYILVLDDCLKLLKTGGHLIADNITKDDCRNFKEVVLNHKQLKTEIIMIEDGLSCSRKIS
ncbi:hypothetical protein COV20_00260 [Candidatus Woesearchaeota archaeon CG10_big_fil_rev_8_21_14_0_10_45_16]|nr:MAG: hypothetical protein COV20_00260 [Candidatus Woesearchaeota archaeon CG10_big_fil_rev_8_21_14_0_10_45_16]